jgi:hypothetical protein
VKFFIFLASLTLFSNALAAEAVIKIYTNSKTIELPYESLEEARFTLGLGETVDRIEVVGSSFEIEAEQIFETSVSVQDEGPHWDLTSWKHGYTEAVPLVKSREGFKTLRVPIEGKGLPFPKVTHKEFIKEVKRTGAPAGLAKSAGTCKDVRTYPCDVGVSRVEFLIGEKAVLHGTIKKKIVFVTPMGC